MNNSKILKKYNKFLNEGTSSQSVRVGEFNLDDAVYYKRMNGQEGRGFVSSILIYSSRIGNKDELSISVKGGIIPQISYDSKTGEYSEMDGRKIEIELV